MYPQPLDWFGWLALYNDTSENLEVLLTLLLGSETK